MLLIEFHGVGGGDCRQLRIDFGDIDLLALSHRGKYYPDLSLAFGFRSGSNFFLKISDPVRFILNKHGFGVVLNYLDDSFCILICLQKFKKLLRFKIFS